MCTLFLFINQFSNIPIALVSNRDELKARKSLAIQGWSSNLSSYGNDIIAPKDEFKKGTWFACQNKLNAKWAVLTNIRDPNFFNHKLNSRGEIVLSFLNSELSAPEFLKILIDTADNYNFFNIIFSDNNYIYYFHSKNKEFLILHKNGDKAKKLFGLSNGKLDSNWPKIIKTKEIFLKYILNNFNNTNEFYWNYFKNEMINSKKYELIDLPQTGESEEIEVFLSSLFIQGEKYGTRTTLFFGIENNSSMFFYEQSYDLNSLSEFSKKISLRFYEIE